MRWPSPHRPPPRTSGGGCVARGRHSAPRPHQLLASPRFLCRASKTAVVACAHFLAGPRPLKRARLGGVTLVACFHAPVPGSTCAATAHLRSTANDDRLVNLSWPEKWMATTTPPAPPFDLRAFLTLGRRACQLICVVQSHLNPVFIPLVRPGPRPSVGGELVRWLARVPTSACLPSDPPSPPRGGDDQPVCRAGGTGAAETGVSAARSPHPSRIDPKPPPPPAAPPSLPTAILCRRRP